MTDFCPDGYLPTRDAVVRAAQSWFPDKFAALEPTAAPEKQTEPKNGLEAAVRIFSQPSIPDAWRHAFEEVSVPTVSRLRNFLYQGTLQTYYFSHDGCHSVSREFWATAQADGALESSTYWPFGQPTRRYDERLVLRQLDLDALLSEQPSEKLPLPKAKLPNLVAALRKLDHLPNRKKQREALHKSPEFAQYRLTDDVLREAEKQVPREPGRRYCSARGIGPASVDDRIFDEYWRYRTETTALASNNTARRFMARTWNACADAIDGWPLQRLTEPPIKVGRARLGLLPRGPAQRP